MENERVYDVFSATEQSESAAFLGWTQKLKFDRSFTAKLSLADDKVKGFYTEIASALLAYDRVRSRTGWSGVSFSVGRERVAFIAVTGKTLCVYLAPFTEELPSSRYKAKDVSSVKARAKTPLLWKIKSDGAKNYVLRRIEDYAKNAGWKKREVGQEEMPFAAPKIDSFQNLITRGLIRIVRNGVIDRAKKSALPRAETNGAYADTVDTLQSILERHGAYDEILSLFSDGEGKASLSQKQILRCVDEIWVNAVEDCLSALDELIRNPNHFIAESEDVLPIEKTKRISGRSIAHLCRHTDYVSVGRNGDITPTKMLNVFREDSLLTYENKFLNTLVYRLYAFVDKRYKIAREYGADETLSEFVFENAFTHGDGKGKVKISVEYSERNLNADVKNGLLGTGLWKRVERLHDIVGSYMQSSFVKAMEKNFVHPPILRTNAILKNKYFRECLALWEFIERYDDAGYGITVEEKSQEISDEYVRTAYAGAAMQYLLFRKALDDDFEDEDEPSYIRPEFTVAERQREEFEEKFFDESFDGEIEDDVTFALRVALAADEQTPSDTTGVTFMQRTFHARLRTADEGTKASFVELANALLRYERVKMRQSKKYAAFSVGRRTIAKITVSEKTVKLYLALNETPNKYHAYSVADKKAFEDTPVCLRVRGSRSLGYAKRLIAELAEELSLQTAENAPQTTVADYPTESLAEMLQKGWVSFSRRSSFPSAKAFGKEKNARLDRYAEETRRNAVQPTKPQPLPATEKNERYEPSENARAVARDIGDLIRPTGNYERPTEYGVDDASGFMSDERERANADNGENV